MSLFAFALVILAAFIHAAWNLLAKRAAHAGPAFVFAYTAVACVVYLPWVIWLIGSGSVSWSGAGIACVAVSGALHLAYSLFLQRGYQAADLSVVYPVARGSAPLLSTVGAIVLLGERPGAASIAGLLAIVTGIVLISTQGRLSRFADADGRKGVHWGTTTGAAIAGYTVVDAYGVKMLGIQPVVLDWCANAVRLAMLLPWFLANRRDAMTCMQGHWGLAIAVGMFSPLSYILVLLALRLGAPLSVTAPAREMSMMVGALLGAWILKESVGRWRLLGCLVTIIGVAMLARS
ncbi:DMT family transporter [Paracandidimonas soli]|uniref:DMT family transporter n=1 Tax=Paracandidimonas soli TaxID=1917182 RepID=UPI003342B98A